MPSQLDQPKHRALVVDNNEAARYVLRRTLERFGLAVDEVDDGFACLTAAARGAPDVIILDLLMPGMSGWSVLQRLRLDVATAGIPVIVHTSYPEEYFDMKALGEPPPRIVFKSMHSDDTDAAGLRAALVSLGLVA